MTTFHIYCDERSPHAQKAEAALEDGLVTPSTHGGRVMTILAIVGATRKGPPFCSGRLVKAGRQYELQDSRDFVLLGDE